jgi:hypothetical protein
MNITTIHEALKAAVDSDAPTTEKRAAKLTGALQPHLTELRDWVTELESLLDWAEQTTGTLAETDEERDGDKDREGVHGDWTDAASQLRDHLAGLHVPA